MKRAYPTCFFVLLSAIFLTHMNCAEEKVSITFVSEELPPMSGHFCTAPPPGVHNEAWQVRDQLFIVYNATTTICEDGLIGPDSDVDFLCDRDELNYGFDPAHRFSLPPGTSDAASKQAAWRGYGDYFRWRALRFQETLIPCQDRTDADHDLLTKCEEEQYMANDKPLGTTEQRGHPEQFDMDGDGFLDGIEFAQFRRGAYVMDYTNVRRIFDGEPEDAGLQIRQHRNPLKRDSHIKPFELLFDPQGYTEKGQQCFNYTYQGLHVHVTVDVPQGNTLVGLEHAAGENVVLIFFIQTPISDPHARGVLFYDLKKVTSNAPLKLTPESFSTY